MGVFEPEIYELYGGQLRARVCGVHVLDHRILMVHHRGAKEGRGFWSPPGGSIQFGETASQALRREILEETLLQATIGRFLFINEFISPPLHALELFFVVEQTAGTLATGFDPELAEDQQIILEVAYLSLEEIRKLPKGSYHSFFSKCNTVDDIFDFQGYIAVSD